MSGIDIISDTSGKGMIQALNRIASAINHKASEGVIYGMHISGGTDDTDHIITYLHDAVGMTPAKMDYANDAFSWGSWHDAFFMPKPCMLKYDGTVDYYLDVDDYNFREDGVTPSDVKNTSYEGNAMMEFPKIWWKIIPQGDDESSAYIYISNYQADEDYHCWSNINCEGKEVEHFYMAIFRGTTINGRMRSIAGLPYTSLTRNQSAQSEINLAKANNQSADELWYTETYADNILIQMLTWLITKSTDVQKSIGRGVCGLSYTESLLHGTDTDLTKGLFYGKSDSVSDMVLFGIHNYYGNQWSRMAGLILQNGVTKVKMHQPYSLTADGYDTLTDVAPSGSSGGYISKMKFSATGFCPNGASGSDGRYYSDGLWFNNTITAVALRGGTLTDGSLVGFAFNLADGAGYAHWNIGSSLSCKPLAG